MAKVVNLFGETEDEDLLEEEAPSAPAAEVREVAQPNAVTTRGREQMVEQVPGTPAPQGSLQLLSVFGSDGKVRVALALDGERIEDWRAPTDKEWHQLRERGRLIRGGIGQAPPAQVPAAPPAAPAPAGQMTIAGIPLSKLLFAGVALVGAGAAFHFWRQHKQMNENLEEVD